MKEKKSWRISITVFEEVEDCVILDDEKFWEFVDALQKVFTLSPTGIQWTSKIEFYYLIKFR